MFYLLKKIFLLLSIFVVRGAEGFAPNLGTLTCDGSTVCISVAGKKYSSIQGKKSQLNESFNGSDKSPPLTSFLEKAANTGIDNKCIKADSLVITKIDRPDLGIFADQTYVLKSVYLQKSNESGEVERIPLPQLDLTETTPPSGYELYVSLYSSMYHDNEIHMGRPVIATPEEVGLVSMKDEVFDSVLVAVPILSFWLGTIFVFVSKYNERYGGNFYDALFGK
mmetsp:Transcript_1731/g.2487  ORF Transcript_1731/g.2487 Transcript_1731/m.2487 type:complete len:223 (+) Transcript_1731:88-756(+)|eukprot:CAMPEP_0203673878 /NCGR_PEP_ID=MMETSP0090-20130426/14198_1 /ASSEMBLY_ACC=CAM_ASM_001088 /TAXON_ID=426623 /ORGANISM="Chaetoceros affinis, Strain CCMP159" /LENGTH=222 /DNA_ID=CAMNT_0050539619 /DNA_START=15 /DNA_END=683 /DNA_ORIENTATION=+